MEIKILPSPETVANEAARMTAKIARASVAERGRFLMAVSGGKTPWLMLRALGQENVPWESMHIFQVDERIAPFSHPDRNLTHIQECLLGNTLLNESQIYAMPVEGNDLEIAATSYEKTLCRIAGTPPIFDLVHLGLGSDGHTASLVPEDRVLEINDRDIAITDFYQGRQRMTLTFPIINRARNIVWVIAGADKSLMLKLLLDADSSIPAGQICQDNAFILADRAAATDIL